MPGVAEPTSDDLIRTSYSDISRASWCARSWYLGSYRGLRQRKPRRTGPLPFGSRYHKVLEISGKADDWSEEAVVARWRQLTEHEWDWVKTRYGLDPDDDMRKESKMGQAMLRAYVAWRQETHHDAHWETLTVEHRYGQDIPVRLPDGRTVLMRVLGMSDVRERRRSDGAVLIVDHKTAANLSNTTLDLQERSIQGPLYLWQEMCEAPEGQWSAGVSYLMHRKLLHVRGVAKPPFNMRLDVLIGRARLNAAKRNIIAKAARVLTMTEQLDQGQPADLVAPYTTGWWCHSCPFKAPCDLMQRGYDQGAADLLADQYEKGDPFERYQDDLAEVDSML